MSNFFTELELLAITSTEVEEHRLGLDRIIQVMKERPYYMEQLTFFSELRKLKPSTLIELDSFMVTDDELHIIIPEDLQHDSYGFVQGSRLIYSGRYVFPVKDTKGHTAGFVGYDKFEEPKYLDSLTYGYKAKRTMMFGMERLPEYYDSGYVFVTEGPICTAFIREIGLNCLSLLGSFMSPYVVEILKRFKDRCIVIPDADETGSHLRNIVRRNLPKARAIQSIVAKDTDDARQVNPDIIEDLFALSKNSMSRLQFYR